MAYDKFSGEHKYANQSYTFAETADYSTSDYVFNRVPTALNCDSLGKLRVDMLEGGTNVLIQVVFGENKLRVTKIYASSPTTMNVVGLS
jgi:hypothetical protein